MATRRQRLAHAFNSFPYKYKSSKVSEAQEQVEAVIASYERKNAGLDIDDEPSTSKSIKVEVKIENDPEALARIANQKKLSTLDTLMEAAEKLMSAQAMVDGSDESSYDNEEDEDEDVEIEFEDDDETPIDINDDGDMTEDEEFELMTIQAVNEARLQQLLSWEATKRRALELLMIEIVKLEKMEPTKSRNSGQGMSDDDSDDSDDIDDDDDNDDDYVDHENQNDIKVTTTAIKVENYDDKENEYMVDADDEEYVPCGSDNKGKRKRNPNIKVTYPPPKRECPSFEFDTDKSSKMITIGPNGTQISRESLENTNWTQTGPAITRKLLCEVFDRSTLAFHTLSGKPSPAFRDCARPIKQPLDPLKVADLVYLMTSTMQMTPREVRTAITTKCADENKMLRTRLLRLNIKSEPKMF